MNLILEVSVNAPKPVPVPYKAILTKYLFEGQKKALLQIFI